ncbi:MogA/MoaB family molybdenum cofactor biosynthesis protein [Actinomyces bowdenii]|uniref:MogA/MoaB family molybdenum cofactor biosynthesis protein n=1 Tax=Actinomyces bowdenii TaxID=131109 RepID=UPI00214C184D|nr:MogA/MoaB family molybdenum cofactor biosynthesis protein [Actinomyces bowdenii]MCR2052346.1 MogA/MoaB family molybdenum cofactor biosynthesis protein [Actinomyces bowdenii]
MPHPQDTTSASGPPGAGTQRPGSPQAGAEGRGAHEPPVVQKGLVPLEEPVRGAVITVSDRCAGGEREDRSGPLAVRLLAQHRVMAPAARVVPDGVEPVRQAIEEALAHGARVVLTTGGTGVTPRDLTPEATIGLLEARLEGLEAQIRAHGLTKTPLAGLSRGLVGVTSRGPEGALVVNAPGSRGGVQDTIAVIGPLVPHVLEQLGGGDH